MKIRIKTTWSGWMTFVVMSAAVPTLAFEPGVAAGPQVPVALAWGPGDTIHVAMRDGRRVVAVDSRTWTVIGGWNLPIRPASMAPTDDRETLLLGGIDGHVVALDVNAGGKVVRDLAV